MCRYKAILCRYCDPSRWLSPGVKKNGHGAVAKNKFQVFTMLLLFLAMRFWNFRPFYIRLCSYAHFRLMRWEMISVDTMLGFAGICNVFGYYSELSRWLTVKHVQKNGTLLRPNAIFQIRIDIISIAFFLFYWHHIIYI